MSEKRFIVDMPASTICKLDGKTGNNYFEIMVANQKEITEFRIEPLSPDGHGRLHFIWVPSHIPLEWTDISRVSVMLKGITWGYSSGKFDQPIELELHHYFNHLEDVNWDNLIKTPI